MNDIEERFFSVKRGIRKDAFVLVFSMNSFRKKKIGKIVFPFIFFARSLVLFFDKHCEEKKYKRTYKKYSKKILIKKASLKGKKKYSGEGGGGKNKRNSSVL